MIVSDQDIEKKAMKILCSAGFLYGKHLETGHGKKIKPSEDAIIYIYTSSSSLFIHFSRNDMLPTV